MDNEAFALAVEHTLYRGEQAAQLAQEFDKAWHRASPHLIAMREKMASLQDDVDVALAQRDAVDELRAQAESDKSNLARAHKESMQALKADVKDRCNKNLSLLTERDEMAVGLSDLGDELNSMTADRDRLAARVEELEGRQHAALRDCTACVNQQFIDDGCCDRGGELNFKGCMQSNHGRVLDSDENLGTGYVDVAIKMDSSAGQNEITDGHGSTWSIVCPDCGERSMEVVRPGKVQCGECEVEPQP